jgi:predicted ATPase
VIRTIEVLNYRALRYVKVDVANFQVLVGPNASGKSTLFDVISFVRDILEAGLEKAFLGDARLDIAPRCFNPKDLTWCGQGGDIEIMLEIELPAQIKTAVEFSYARYELAIGTEGELSFKAETLWLCQQRGNGRGRQAAQQILFPEALPRPESIVRRRRQTAPAGWRRVVSKISDTGNDYFKSEVSDWNNLFRLGPSRSALSNLPEDEQKFKAAIWVKRFLMEHVLRLAFNVEKIRLPAAAGLQTIFSHDGANLPWLVHDLQQIDCRRFELWVEHVQTALPDICAISTAERSEDRARYVQVKYKNGFSAPAWLLSDGTLRLLALTLLAYTQPPASVLLIEEPENGIHPQAMDTVLQSLQSYYGGQIFCATHSPVVLGLVEARDLLCFARAHDGSIAVVRGEDHPRLREWRNRLDLQTLFASGILG